MPIDGVSAINNAYRILSSQGSAMHKISAPVSQVAEKSENVFSTLSNLAAINGAAVRIKTNFLSEFSLEEFLSKNGTFKKGAAYIDNKPYSGIIKARNGENQVLLEYSDGVLRQSTRFKQNKHNEMVPISRKIYSKKDSAKVIESYSLGDKTPQGTHRIGEVTIKPDEIKVMKYGKDLDVTTSKKQKNGSWKIEHEKFSADRKHPNHIQQVKTNTSNGKVSTKDYIIRIT